LEFPVRIDLPFWGAYMSRLDADYGSTTLSESTHKDNVTRLLKLKHPISEILREEFSPNNWEFLKRSIRDFAPVSAGMTKISSFIEDQATTLSARNRHNEAPLSQDSNARALTTIIYKTPVSFQQGQYEHC
jgi:hypothetical protein